MNDKNYLKALIINMMPVLASEAADIESLKIIKESFIAGVVAGCFPSLSEEAFEELKEYSEALNAKVNAYLDISYKEQGYTPIYKKDGSIEWVDKATHKAEHKAKVIAFYLESGLSPELVEGSVNSCMEMYEQTKFCEA